MKRWYMLDHAGKLYSTVSNDLNFSTIRVSMIMKRPVNASMLQQSVDLVIGRFPAMAVKLNSGFFWNYFSKNSNELAVKPETTYPCIPIVPSENNEFLLQILYYKNKITVEASHVLTDATGVVEFLKTLVFQYLSLLGEEVYDDEGKILPPDSFPFNTEDQNSYESYFYALKDERGNMGASQAIDTQIAYQIRGTQFVPYGHNTVHGSISMSALHAIAKNMNCTISTYLITVLYLAINNCIMPFNKKLRNITICVPVNLRRRFPSYSLRNFSTVIRVGMPVSKDIPFEDVLKEFTSQLTDKTETSHLARVFINTMALEKKVLVRYLPLFLKKYAFRLGYYLLGEKTQTISFSNLGKIELPKTMIQHVDAVEAAVSPSPKDPIFCFVYSLEDRLTISFSRNIMECDIIREFFVK